MKRLKPIIAYALALLVILLNSTIAPSISVGQSTPNDISNRLVITTFNVSEITSNGLTPIVLDGQKANNPPKLEVGDNLAFEAKWSIPDLEHPSPAAPGDYIEILLPEAIGFFELTPQEITDNSKYGRPAVVQRDDRFYFRYTFNENILNKKSIDDGFFRGVKGRITEAKENVNLSLTGTVIPITFEERAAKPFAQTPWAAWERENDEYNLLKEGGIYYTENKIDWNIWANFYGLQEAMEEPGTTPSQKYIHEDLVLVDYMPPGFDIAPEDLNTPITDEFAAKTIVRLYARIYAPTPEPKPGIFHKNKVLHHITDSSIYDLYLPLDLKKAIRNTAGESLEDFITRVNQINKNKESEGLQKAIANTGKRTLGIYTHRGTFKEKTKIDGNIVELEYQATQHIIVVAMGNVGSGSMTADTATYQGVYELRAGKGNNLETFIENYNHSERPINDIQKTIMKRVYGGNQPVRAWMLYIQTALPETKKNLYVNNAEMRSSNQATDKESRTIHYILAEAGADADLVMAFVPVEKHWVGTSDTPEEVLIDLYADNQPTNKTLTLSKVGGWVGTFQGLEKYRFNESGQIVPIYYSVKERPVSGYTSEVEQRADGTFVVTNTKIPVVDPGTIPEQTSPTTTEATSSEETETTESDGGEDYFPPITTSTSVTTTETSPVTTTDIVTMTSPNTTLTTTTSPSTTEITTSRVVPSETATSELQNRDSDAGEDYFSPTTTTTPDPLFDIDDDDAARGNSKKKKKNGANGEDDSEEDDSQVSADALPTTGNMPNALFYATGAFIAVLGLLIIMLQKIRM